MTEKKHARLDKAFAALLSADDAQALEALAVIHEQGDAGSIIPLLQALAQTESTARQRRIERLLYEVKVPQAASELARALDMQELKDVRRTALAAFWNAGLDAAPFVEKFVQIALEGDADETFEVLTVLENQELLPERPTRLALNRLRKAVDQEKDPYKHRLLEDLRQHLIERLGAEEPQQDGH